ncbi:MAG: DUF523 domain-containing protein [SAR324 cluster bacterium]|nr:DUF523 domain-containing protein [SAR324 cluster bacterium]
MLEKILVSSCLLGQKVRYNGTDKKIGDNRLDKWLQEGRVIPFCPEVAAALPVPRAPAEISGGDGNQVHDGTAEVIDADMQNVSKYFVEGAKLAFAEAKRAEVKVALLKADSPSCGNKDIHDGTFSGKKIVGSGVTAALLEKKGIPVFNENELGAMDSYVRNLENMDKN